MLDYSVAKVKRWLGPSEGASRFLEHAGTAVGNRDFRTAETVRVGVGGDGQVAHPTRRSETLHF